MLRVELFVLIGITIGFPLGWFVSALWRRFLAARDAYVANKMAKVRAAEVLDYAGTSELLEELSTREDLVTSGGAFKGPRPWKEAPPPPSPPGSQNGGS